VRARIKAACPVLPSQDVAVSIEFYVNRLGFKLTSQDSATAPRYAVVVRGGAELHIQWHDPAEWSAAERPHIRFPVSSVQKLHDEYKGAGIFHAKTALRDTSWGTREFAFYDPYSNGLTFYEDI
jgi:catechol 2,3-dioxygenase-like lactoylglutathione lyase family enzyme